MALMITAVVIIWVICLYFSNIEDIEPKTPQLDNKKGPQAQQRLPALLDLKDTDLGRACKMPGARRLAFGHNLRLCPRTHEADYKHLITYTFEHQPPVHARNRTMAISPPHLLRSCPSIRRRVLAA